MTGERSFDFAEATLRTNGPPFVRPEPVLSKAEGRQAQRA